MPLRDKGTQKYDSKIQDCIITSFKLGFSQYMSQGWGE